MGIGNQVTRLPGWVSNVKMQYKLSFYLNLSKTVMWPVKTSLQKKKKNQFCMLGVYYKSRLASGQQNRMDSLSLN
jgi:hypothetical protein